MNRMTPELTQLNCPTCNKTINDFKLMSYVWNQFVRCNICKTFYRIIGYSELTDVTKEEKEKLIIECLGE
tara:strand:+ start:575 stop:784 length:210 start_codon:yes stop_codon:yes gene_type:complete